MPVPRAPVTIGIIVTFMLHSFFQFSSKVDVLTLFSHFLDFTLWSAGTAKSTVLQVLFFFLFWSGRLAEIRWWICISKSYFTFCEFFTPSLAFGLLLESLQVFKTLLLADLNNVPVWMVSIRLPISNSSSPPPFFQGFRDCSQCASSSLCYHHLQAPQHS